MPDALAVLLDLAEAPAGDDQEALHNLRAQYPGRSFDLALDIESYDGSVHRDLIIRAPHAPTVSVSVAPSAGLPWPLRGVVRSHDRDLVEVNGTRVEVAEAMAGVDMIVRDRSLMQIVVDGCLIKAELEREPVTLVEAEIQQAADAFRRAKGLVTRELTQRWLDARGLNADTFAELVRRQAELDGLRRRVVTDDRVESWLASHAAELADLVVAWIEAKDSEPVDRAQLVASPLVAVLAAAGQGRESGVRQLRAEGLVRSDGTVADAVEGGVYDVVLDGPAVAVVLQCRPARIDRATRALVRARLFAEWLAVQRRTARVTWFWGAEQQTR